MSILKRFQEAGAPIAAVSGWTGRWWSVWGPTDVVPIGDKVLLAVPGAASPFAKVGELTVTAPDEATISYAGAFASYGEPARLIRDADGAVTTVQIAGGRLVTEAALAAELVERYEG